VIRGGLVVRSYDSFVLRCWGLRGERLRIKLEHIQSGASTRVTNLTAAMDWIRARSWLAAEEPSEAVDDPATEERG